jgi:hypothetical protein
MRYGKRFWRAAAERALKTLAQSAVALIGASALMSDVDWALVASGAALAAVLSLLTSVASPPSEVAAGEELDGYKALHSRGGFKGEGTD